MKKRVFVLSVLCVLVCLSWGKAVIFEYKGPDGNTLKYILKSETANEVTVGNVTCNEKDYPLLPRKSLSHSYKYESVTIPETVTYKGKKYTVTGIGHHAFFEGPYTKPEVRLKKIVFPKTIKEITESAFEGCSELQEIHICDLKAWCEILYVDVRFKHSHHSPFRHFYYNNLKLYLNGELITKLVVPNGVKILTGFSGVQSIESVTMPPSVEHIGVDCFDGCKKLKKVEFSSSLKTIGDHAFSECRSLQYIQIPEGVMSIGSYAFSGCNLLELRLPSSLKTIPESTFMGNEIKTIIIPKSIENIGKHAFWSCESLESVKFLNPETTLGKEVFFNCKKLTKVMGLSSKSKIDKDAFTGSSFSLEQYMKTSFMYFASGRLRDEIDNWQKKSEFETTDQWRSRVTVANREAKIKEVTENLKKEFMERHRKTEPTAVIGTYNADQGVFPISIGSEIVYVKVPQSEAQQFKAQFKSEYIQTQYDIADDHVAVVERACKVGDKAYQTTNQYAKADDLSDLALNLPPLEMDFGNVSNNTSGQKTAGTPVDRTIDQNIPASGVTNSNTFAVIIGNENYSMVAKVPFAKNDAQVFAEYCRKTLGVTDKNVRTYGDATYGMMKNAIKDIQNIAKAYNGNINVIFYYAGHGIPNENSKDAYLLPVDADGKQMDVCYSVGNLYKELGSLGAKNVVVFLDACFSGAQRGEGMLASARGVAIKAKAETPQGNMVVFSAAQGDETAYPYNEKGHGMFTYFLLKKLQESKGGCTLGELGEYIQTNVRQQSVVVNRKSQTPTVNPASFLGDNWKNWKLR